MVATKLGVFDVLAERPHTASAAAQELEVNDTALEKLLNLLVATGYLRRDGSHYGLTRLARKWMIRDAPASIRDNILLRFLEWQAIEGAEEYVRTGTALDAHRLIEGEQWGVYQRGMRSLARLSAAEVTRRTRFPRGARTMLDIGGAHGAYSVAFCRRHPQLKATILDLPQALEATAPILAEEKLGERLVSWSGNALTEDLGRDQWDFIFVGHLVHHFERAANQDLIRRAADALRPYGVLAILDVLRSTATERVSASGAMLDLFFAVTSNSGTWSYQELADWIKNAGLTPGPAVHLRTAPGVSVVTGTKAVSRG
jgi:SAM-dependent methyltransferase